jgi:hypothetical protein
MPITPSKFPDQPAADERDMNQDKDGKAPSGGRDANDGDKGAEDLGEDEGAPE